MPNSNTVASGSQSSVVSLETLETSQQSPSEKVKKKRQRRERRGREHTDLVNSLRCLGYEDAAADVASCGRLHVAQCGSCTGLAARQCFSCKHRLCPWCAQTKGERKARQLVPAILTFQNPVLLTLTVKNRLSLADADEHLRSSWKKLQRRGAFKAAFAGGFVFEEVTYGVDGWHAHLHIIADGYFDQGKLAELWEEITGDSRIVWIEWIKPHNREKAIREACKYPTKLSVLNGSPELVREFLEHFKSRRMCWSWGSARGLLSCAELDDDDDDQVEPEVIELAARFCPHCGGFDTMLPSAGVTWDRSRCKPWAGGIWWLLDDPPPPGAAASPRC